MAAESELHPDITEQLRLYEEVHVTAEQLAIGFRSYNNCATTPPIAWTKDAVDHALKAHHRATIPYVRSYLPKTYRLDVANDEIMAAVESIRAVHATHFKPLFEALGVPEEITRTDRQAALEAHAQAQFIEKTRYMRPARAARHIAKATTRMLEKDMDTLLAARQPQQKAQKPEATEYRSILARQAQLLGRGACICMVAACGMAIYLDSPLGNG